jgi:hypothetical protein
MGVHMRHDPLSTILHLLATSVVVFLLAGCSNVTVEVPRSGSGFLKREFLDYRSVAVLPFEGDHSGEVAEEFAVHLRERFPSVSVVDMLRVRDALGPAMVPVPLDQKTRYVIRDRLGVNAVVAGAIHFPSIVKWLLQIEILDIASGEIVGRSLVEEQYSGALKKKAAARLAVENLQLR